MSSSFTLRAGFDPASMRIAQRFVTWPLFFEPRMEWATTESLDDLRVEAQNWMEAHFMNPTGDLSDSLEMEVDSPFEGWMGTYSPYGRRRNWGFSGMTDSLGRYYPLDPGIAWAENAIANAFPHIQNNYELAAIQAFQDVGAI
jgi:hypothetical protein